MTIILFELLIVLGKLVKDEDLVVSSFLLLMRLSIVLGMILFLRLRKEVVWEDMVCCSRPLFAVQGKA